MNKIKKESFLKNVKDHKMEIITSHGVNRHLKFKNPKNCYYSFEIITWDGSLCISGDMGTFVFRRLSDMFDFFYCKKDDLEKLEINESYWHGKLVAVDDQEGSQEYSREVIEERLKYDLKDYCEYNKDDLEENFFEKCWEELEGCIEETPEATVRSLNNFSYEDYTIEDAWELDCEDYTPRFIWCLYAIVWAISEFNKENKNV